MNLSKKVVVSGVLATLASVCFVAGVTLLTVEGGNDSNETSSRTNLDDRSRVKY